MARRTLQMGVAMPERTHSAEIHAGLDHPVVDGDGHWLEPMPVFLDYLRDIGGSKAVDAFFAARDQRSEVWYQMTPAERKERRHTRPTWWGFPGSTIDRATVMMPSLLSERLEEFGIDFSIVYPTLGLLGTTLPNVDFRRAFIRALNTMTAEMFADYSSQFAPVGIVPTHTPEEAIDELEHVVGELKLKAILINGTIKRPVPAYASDPEDVIKQPYYIDTLALDSVHDYDPLWRRCAELGVAVTTHSGSIGWTDRQSVSSFVANHLGHFAQSNHTFARALFLGGVTRRFPNLNFAFLEGGIGWACNLYADLIGHWEKRSHGPMLENLRPTNVDQVQLRQLLEQHGGKWLDGRADAVIENLDCFYPGLSAQELTDRETDIDEFAAVGIESKADIQTRFADNFYFGCEADDPITAWAFDERMDTRLKPIFSSDVAHFDVIDMTEVLEEAWEMVDDGLLTEADFRRFTFSNAVELHGRMNPAFFAETVVEAAAEAELAALGARKEAASTVSG